MIRVRRLHQMQQLRSPLLPQGQEQERRCVDDDNNYDNMNSILLTRKRSMLLLNMIVMILFTIGSAVLVLNKSSSSVATAYTVVPNNRFSNMNNCRSQNQHRAISTTTTTTSASNRIYNTVQYRKAVVLPLSRWGLPSRLYNSMATNNDDESNDDNPEKDGQKQQKKKRDVIKDWVYGSNKNMVRPIRLDGSVIMDDDDDDDMGEQQERIQSKFGNLFAGMPTLNEILQGTSGENNDDTERSAQQQPLYSSSSSSTGTTRTRTPAKNGEAVDDTWFDNDREKITKLYNEMYVAMMNQIETERRQQEQREQEQEQREQSGMIENNENNEDDSKKKIKRKKDANDDLNAIPENAEALIRSILQQEMDNEINVTKEKLSKERLVSYEQDLTKRMNSFFDDTTTSASISANEKMIPNNEKVQKLMQESEVEYQQQQKYRMNLDEFLQYEQDTKKQQRKDDEDNTILRNYDIISSPQSSSLTANNVDENQIDQWVLDRFQEMITKNENKENGNENIMDNLVDNFDTLTNRMQQQQRNSHPNMTTTSTIDETMFDTIKEWQMYRSIATRLSSSNISGSSSTSTNDDDAEKAGTTSINVDNDEKILAMLQSWKEYIAKEENIRKLSGLSTLGPKLPFRWQEADLEERLRNQMIMADTATTTDSNNITKLNAIDARKQINKMSIDAMESLLSSRSIDTTRRQNLQKELDYLKATLIKTDYLDIDVDETNDTANKNADQGTAVNPIDTKNLFIPFTPDDGFEFATSILLDDYDNDDFSTSNLSSSFRTAEIDQQQNNIDVGTDDSSMISSSSATRSPNTPFFATDSPDDNDNTMYSYNTPKERTSVPPPPNTPFFSDVTTNIDMGESDTDYSDTKLGSMEDQKLEAMYRRAGAKTAIERATIKNQYEEFKSFEQSKRQQSGLSRKYDSDDDDGDAGAIDGMDAINLRYNVSEIMKDDGDFDADTILASIGPRPTRTKKTTSDPSIISRDGVGVKNPSIVDERMKSKVDAQDILESRYRAVSAVGGGRYKDDPEENLKQQASYEDFMEKENRLRELVETDSLVDEETIADLDIPDSNVSSFDDVKYAEEVIASLGARPKPKRTRIDERSFSDQGGVLAASDDVDDDDETDDGETDDDDVSSEENSIIPDWLRKEQEEAASNKMNRGSTKRKTFLGSDIDDVFDDTDYEHNMRQLAEYERRRAGDQRAGSGTSGGRRSMGIDISDVLGPRRGSLFQSDDYADYKYNDNEDERRIRLQDDWGAGSFEARKRDLLDYIELDVRGINALMDHRDSVHSTGVSQYLRRINKPFKEFGAILRLEGVLIDVTGLHLEAWTKVANDYKFKAPTIEEARQASVIRPEVAVKDIFFWAENFIECKNIALDHRDALRQSFDSWTMEAGLTVPSEIEHEVPASELSGQGTLAMGSEDTFTPTTRTIRNTSNRVVSESEKIEIMAKAWARAAEMIGQPKPSRDDVVPAMVLTPDVAIKQIFGWSDDPIEIDSIVQVYRKNLRAIYEGNFNEPAKRSESSSETTLQPAQSTKHSKKPLTQNDAMEFHHKAWTSVADKYNFDPPVPDESIAAFVLNDPEIAVRDGFGWTEDPVAIANAVKDFRRILSELMDGKESVFSPVEETARPIVEKDDAAKSGMSGPNADDVFQASHEAWLATARIANLPPPDDEQVVFALSVGPEEAIVTGFQWATTNDDVAKLLSLYRVEIGKVRSKWTGSSNIPIPVTPVVNKKPKPSSSNGPTADDLFLAAFESWAATATKMGFESPDQEQVQFAMSVGPEEAIMNGFDWTNESTTVQEIVAIYRQELSMRKSEWQQQQPLGWSTTPEAKENSVSLPKVRLIPGAVEWIQSLLNNEMQVGVVSYLERDHVDVLLRFAGLNSLISSQVRVSASNKYSTDDDQLLGMALRLERRPDHCAVFDSTPYASVAAHNVEMQSVNIIGPYPRYELLASDATTASFTDLTAMNIRRLFSERIYDQPLEEAQASLQKKTNTKTKTRFSDDDM